MSSFPLVGILGPLKLLSTTEIPLSTIICPLPGTTTKAVALQVEWLSSADYKTSTLPNNLPVPLCILLANGTTISVSRLLPLNFKHTVHISCWVPSPSPFAELLADFLPSRSAFFSVCPSPLSSPLCLLLPLPFSCWVVCLFLVWSRSIETCNLAHLFCLEYANHALRLGPSKIEQAVNRK